MKIFAELAPSPRNETLTEAVRAVVSQLRPLKSPRSLCEIAIDAEDRRWLTEWAKSLSPRRTTSWLDGIDARRVALQADGINLTYAESFGCLFLLLASETARRESTEGRVWADIRKAYPPYIESALFMQGQPRDILKYAMESTARKLRLRHVYGQAGTQEYYLSVYLQFGFTRRGFLSRLPEWLAGQGTPESAQRLLGIGGDRLASESFIALWDTLKNYRRNNITESSARARIAANHWTLPEWTDDLLKRALAKLTLGTADIEQNPDIEEQHPPEFLSAPKLRWSPPSAPEFVCEIENLADFDLTSDRYLIQSGDATLARLFRAEDGSYRAEPAEITFAPDSPHQMAALMDDSGDSPASQAVALWEPMEDVEAFDLRGGNQIDAWGGKFANGREYGLLLSGDLDVQPGSMVFHAIGDSKKLYRFRADSANRAKVFLEGEELWSSERKVKPSAQSDDEPDWAKSVSVSIEPSNRVKLSESTVRSLRVYGLGRGTSLAYVRVGNVPLDFRQDEYGDWLTSEFDVLPFCLRGAPPFEMEVNLGLRNGVQNTRITQTLILSPIGVLRLSGDGWRAVNPSESLSVSEAKRNLYRVLMPSSFNKRGDFALMEGPVFLRRLWTHPRALESLGGYGESLGIRAPYNWLNDGHFLELSQETCDQGILDACMADRSGKLRLWLSRPIEPGPKHSVIFWTPNQAPIIIEAAKSVAPSDSFTTWDASLPDNVHEDDAFIAIAYDGARIGAKWPAYPHGLSYVDKSRAFQTAAMLRWMRAPIVSGAWIDEVRSLASNHPGHILAAWLGEAGLPEGLSHSPSGEQWMSAVRRVFAEWEPDMDGARAALSALGYARGLDNRQIMLRSFLRLLDFDPVLTGRVARLGKRNKTVREAAWTTRLLIAGLPEGAAEYDAARCENDLLEQASQRMGAATQFLNNIARKVTQDFHYSNLNAADRNNAETALTVAPFREYLGMRTLTALLS